ncbi:MAG: fibronectin-binding domain-containing protein [Promethearchaeota archaeon]|nr:MAG: fibronectin-binding domain-containing protein [Candidatus Lokiarchaeota archaeon]
MKFSNFDVYAICKELDSLLSGGRISNVYEVDDILILKVHTNSYGKKNLIIKDDSRINITEYDYPIPKYPSQFTSSLRKFLKNRKILSITQYKFDRIIIIELSSFEADSWKFVIELFNKGNFILLDEDNIVKIAKSYKKFRDRDILANREYSFPSSRGESFLTLKKEDFINLISNAEGEIVRILANFISFSGIYSEEICYRAKVDKTKKVKNLTKSEIQALYQEFKKLRNEILFGKINAHIIYDENQNPVQVFPIDLISYNDFEKKYFDSFNHAVDEFYSRLDSLELKQPQDAELKQKLVEQKKILKRQQEYLEDLKEEKIKYYQYGDLIYSRLNSLERLFGVIKKARNKGYNYYEINDKLKGAKEKNFDSLELFLKIDPATKKILIKINDGEVKLDLRKSVGENANNLYNKGKKIEKKIAGTLKAISETKKQIKKLNEKKVEIIDKVEFLIKPPKQKWYEKYRWFKSSEGFLVIGGKDASSNEAIFRKYLDKNDIVLHTNFPGSPLMIIKNPNNEKVSENTISEAAEFVASYSRAWKENWGVIDVFYVNSDQVSKTPPSGEFLPKGSFMISGKKNFIKNSKTKLALALKYIRLDEEIDDKVEEIFYPKIVIGPLSAIKNRYEDFLTIRPSKSGYSKGKIAKQIKTYFFNKSKEENKKWVDLLSLDDVINVLPSGLSKIET